MISKVSFNQFMWSQIDHIPKEHRFFYTSPHDSAAFLTWYENGNMRANPALDLNLDDPFLYPIDQSRLRGEVIAAGSFLEMVIEGMVYVNLGMYNPDKMTPREQIAKIMSDKVDRRADWLRFNDVISQETRALIRQFFTFRNKLAHTYTFKDLTYRGQLINEGNWEKISKRIEKEYTQLASQLISDYYAIQTPLIEYLFNSIKASQIKEGGPTNVNQRMWWTYGLEASCVDARGSTNWLELIDPEKHSYE